MEKINLHTPCFILDEQDVTHNIHEFKTALNSYFTKNIIGYSVKTNSLPYVLKIAKDNGCYAEVVSYHEYQLALKVGFQKDHIIYNGPMKSKESFLDAIEHRAILNIETWRELGWLDELPKNQEYEIGIRININTSIVSPEDADHPDDDSRFGFSFESGDLDKVINLILKKNNIKIVGIHSHREPKTRSVRFYERVICHVQEIILKYNLSLKYWDLGGGFFGCMPNKPTYDEYAKAFFNALDAKLRDITFIVEPGNAIVASGFNYIAEVIDVKTHDGKIYVCTDGTRNDIDPFFHKSDYFKEFFYQSCDSVVSQFPQVVSGLTCLEYDRMFTIPAGERKLSVGDRIIFHRVGAYTMSLTPLFIHYFPTIYLKNPNGHLSVIREEWCEDDFIQKSKY